MDRKDDAYTKRLRERARRFDERGRKGTLVQLAVEALDRQASQQTKKVEPLPKKKDKGIEEEKDNG